MIQSKIQKWGNSQGVRFPKHLLEEVGIAVGDQVEIRATESGIELRALEPERKRYCIVDLAKRMPADYVPAEATWGIPVGNEIW